jgi:hypothetical protein
MVPEVAPDDGVQPPLQVPPHVRVTNAALYLSYTITCDAPLTATLPDVACTITASVDHASVKL